MNIYDDTCSKVLQYAQSKDKLIKKSVILLIPILAGFNPTVFKEKHLHASLGIILTDLKNGVSRNKAYISIGRIVLKVGIGKQYIIPIISAIKEGLKPQKGKPTSYGALACAAMMSQKFGKVFFK
jgi:serine/threonine-protein kinase mTOR